MKLESGPFFSRDGTRLHGEWHYPAKAARGVAVILHGYDDHGGRYVEVAKRLNELGLAAFAIDYRGHGRADGRRGHCQRFEEYLDDLDAALTRARLNVERGPLLIVGHSHGSLIALRALTDPARAPRVDGVVLSSPFLGMGGEVPAWKQLAGKVTSRALPALSLPNGLKLEDLTHDREMLQWTKRDGLRHGVATSRWYTECVEAQSYVLEHAGRLKVPSFWPVGAADPVVDVEATRQAFARAGGDKTLKLYEGYYHEVFNEVGRATVYADLGSWITSKFLAS
jgi:alpha-beta hydrolase superfamily lysophospholipase